MSLLAALLAAAALGLALAPTSRLPGEPDAPPPAAEAPPGRLPRHRWLWSALGAVGALTFLGGAAGAVAAPVVAVVVWVVAGRAEPPSERRRRAAVRRQLPHLVALVGAGLRAGADPIDAVAAVCRALPGPASEALATVVARLRLGADPAGAWAVVAADPDLGPLGRAMVRAHRSGAPVVQVVERLALELARADRAEVEERARAVGVKAAVPLGLCLLPAFVLIGIVPLAAGLFSSLGW